MDDPRNVKVSVAHLKFTSEEWHLTVKFFSEH
jgi:hypothetical protein